MKDITLYLGLDVHKDSITIAIAEPGAKGDIRLFGTISKVLGAENRPNFRAALDGRFGAFEASIH